MEIKKLVRARLNTKKRNRVSFRHAVIEQFERRELMAADVASPIFAPGTTDAYVQDWINRLAGNSIPGFPSRSTGGPIPLEEPVRTKVTQQL
jgi:hypothetical protein